MIRTLFMAFVTLVTPSSVLAQDRFETAESRTKSIRLSEASPLQTRFGKLEFLGGLEWSSERADFGGLSGAILDEDGVTLTAVTDKAHWIRTRLQFDAEGGLNGIGGFNIWRLYGADGKFLQRPFTDSEAITRDGDTLLISFEREHRVSRFEGLSGPEITTVKMPDFSNLQSNKGIEALVKLPDGRLFMLAEEPPLFTGGKHHIGWVLGGETKRQMTLRRSGSYSPTDLALSPDGQTVYLLERRFSYIGGPGMRISRFPVSVLDGNRRIKPETLVDLGSGYEIDNMEALVTRKSVDGATELLVLSDDNFSNWQRTLLLHFRVLK